MKLVVDLPAQLAPPQHTRLSVLAVCDDWQAGSSKSRKRQLPPNSYCVLPAVLQPCTIAPTPCPPADKAAAATSGLLGSISYLQDLTARLQKKGTKKEKEERKAIEHWVKTVLMPNFVEATARAEAACAPEVQTLPVSAL
jgi:hypothetical protein